MALTETTKTLKLPKLTTEIIIERGEVKINEKGDKSKENSIFRNGRFLKKRDSGKNKWLLIKKNLL